MRQTARITTLLLSAGLALSLGACTADRLEPGEAAGIQALHIVPPAEPRRYDVNVFAAPAMGVRIGAYDAVLANEIMRTPAPGDIDSRLTSALTQKAGLRLGAELAAAIATSLRRTGHAVTSGHAPADATPSATTSAAATLDIALLYAGYVDQPLRHFTPFLLAEITLTDAGGHRLARQRYSYGRLPYLADDIRIIPDPRYTFADETALLADPSRAAEGLRAALPGIAADVGASLQGAP